MSDIKVMLIEDHDDIREGLTFLINSTRGFSCQNFAAAEDALHHLISNEADVVLMDINLPGMSGIECTRIIRDKYKSIQVIMCTVYEDDEKIFKALQAGANGYILKKSSPAPLITAIKDVLNGLSPMSGEIARKVVESFRNKLTEAVNHLSNRESEILDLLALGHSNKEIAEKLFISVHTVRNHLFNIYEKLHVHSRTEALSKIRR